MKNPVDPVAEDLETATAADQKIDYDAAPMAPSNQNQLAQGITVSHADYGSVFRVHFKTESGVYGVNDTLEINILITAQGSTRTEYWGTENVEAGSKRASFTMIKEQFPTDAEKVEVEATLLRSVTEVETETHTLPL